MPADPTPYLDALRQETKTRIKAQVMHDLSIIAAGVVSSGATPEEVARRAIRVYQELKQGFERYIEWKETP